jgi:hypothetical protein
MTEWQLIITAQGSECWDVAPDGRTFAENVFSMLSKSSGRSVVVSSDRALVPMDIRAKVLISPPNEGALCTALFACDEIDMSIPLIVAPGNFTLNVDVKEFIEREFFLNEADAFALTFTSQDARLSFARIDLTGEILEYCEKEPVSSVATTGIFGFKCAGEFFEAGKWVLTNNIRTNNKFYVSDAVNYFIMGGKAVKNLHLGSDASVFQKNWSST